MTMHILQNIYSLYIYIYVCIHINIHSFYEPIIFPHLFSTGRNAEFLWQLHGVPQKHVDTGPLKRQEIANVTFTTVGTCGFAGNGVVPFRNSTLLTRYFFYFVGCFFGVMDFLGGPKCGHLHHLHLRNAS